MDRLIASADHMEGVLVHPCTEQTVHLSGQKIVLKIRKLEGFSHSGQTAIFDNGKDVGSGYDFEG
ncbi:hypothetical protein WG66_012941 [Moniliophthora roreri]|nr:hypothetical protein WG66_012941 [Moniliophthora roreri]